MNLENLAGENLDRIRPSLAELNQQLYNPQHCYLDMGSGHYMCHSHNENNPLSGKPLRMTRLAGERILAGIKNRFPKAKLVDEEIFGARN